MASEDTTLTTNPQYENDRPDQSDGPDTTTLGVAPPAKKAARKRAPRKATAAAAAPEPVDNAGTPPAAEALPDPDTAPAPRKRAARKTASAKKAAVALEVPAASSTAKKATKTSRSRRATSATETPAPMEPPADAASAPSAPSAPSDTSADAVSVVDEEALRFDALELPAPMAPLQPFPDSDATPVTVHTPETPDTPETPGPAEGAGDGPPPGSGVVPLFQAPVSRRRRASSPTSSPNRRRGSAAAAPVPADTYAEADAPGVTGPVEVAQSVTTADLADTDADLTDADLTDADLTDLTDLDADADADDHDAVDPEDSTQGSDAGGSPRRRRRRGGKGRRGRSGDHGDSSDSGDSGDSGDASDATAPSGTNDHTDAAGDDSGAQPGTDAAAGGDHEEGSSSSRRRTRRRRRSGGGSDDGDEAPGVTTKVREPRRDEVTALRGSTRLEAKKQRRREGREAGRRRTVITEAEFLARRESVERVMVVRHLGDRTQIGVLEDGVLVEHYISKETEVSMAGNIYLGRVQNVLPSMEAAFVDIGKGRNAVLYAGEVNWDAAGLEQHQARRIENALSSGEGVLAQVTKDPIGHKGARLTSQISLPGRYLVYVPNSSMTGISRKLPDTERARLKKILKDVLPETAGVIVRTAAEGASEEELRADVERLTATWEDIQAKAEAAIGPSTGKKKNKSTGAPVLLHGEPDLTVRVIRDIFNEDFSQLVVAGEDASREVSDYVDSVAPDLAERVTRWTSENDLFTHYRVDEQIAKAMDRKVWLPSGGSLVIDRTEAMTVVDVNTGKFIGSGGTLEETVTKNYIEAAEEIVRQLRLRDVGGIIVIDFIDMVLESNRDLVVRRLLECLGRDRTKHQVAEVTSLGLVQMTRKRVGSGLIEVYSETCASCAGRGFIIHSDPVDKSSGVDHGDHPDHGSHSTSGSSGSSGSNGSNGSNGSQRDQGGRGRSRSRGSDSTAASPAPLRPNGPTPAQIAAAAHAAALKTATYAAQTVLPADTAPELAEAGLVDEGAGYQGEPVEPVGELDAELTEPIQPIQPLEPLPFTEDPVESGPAPEPAPEHLRLAAPMAPVGRPRRHRGRVVAPAGPPRSTNAHGAEGPGPT